jgi:CheY-like chemotaxis protein
MLAAIEVGTVSELLGSVAWPLVVFGLVLLFRKPLLGLLTRDEVELRGPAGISLSARRSAAAVSAVAKAAEEKGTSVGDLRALRNDVTIASREIESLGRPARILWVDDRPSNNRHEKSALEALGMSVELSTSTDDALTKAESPDAYDVVISDMGRHEGPNAGYTLLEALRSRGNHTPFVIYTSSRSAEHFDEAVRRGAIGSTNSPTELIDMVTKALRMAGP